MLTTSDFPADPAAYVVAHTRRRGRLVALAVVWEAKGAPLVTFDDDDGQIDDILARAREEERTNPHDGQIPTDAAIIRAALRYLDITPSDET